MSVEGKSEKLQLFPTMLEGSNREIEKALRVRIVLPVLEKQRPAAIAE